MDKLIEIHWTAGSLDEARRIARYLVQDKLIACAQIIPWVESIFLWNEKMDTEQESLVVLKTVAGHYDRIKEVIESNCQYEVPQITALEITKCNSSYQQWLLESVHATHPN
jgi:periplasmic divalent cation tolerance protein